MLFDRLWYEVRVAWKLFVFTPLLLLAPVGLLTMVQHFFLHQSSARLLLASAEILLPMAAGVIVATTLAHDDAIELHLSAVRPYHATSMLRLLLIAGWVACLAMLMLGALAALRLLYLPDFAASLSPVAQVLLTQLLWLAPLLWMVALGSALAVLTQQRTASGALLGGIWLLDVVFVEVLAHTAWLRPFLLFPATLLLFPATHVSLADFNTYWLNTRFELLGTAMALLPFSWLLLHDTEKLLKGATEE
ncbi:MAG TPA: hypothetical protein VF916_10175 [Ktedonobacterales bacterium]|jgi:hypothetical protein